MREGISLITLFKALVVFTLIFSAFASLTIVYNKAFKLKNEVLTIIEKYEGVTDTSLEIINNYLKENGYVAKGSCLDGEYGSKNLENTELYLSNDGEKYFYCISQICPNSGSCSLQNSEKIYFKFKLFFKFNLPFFEDLLTFPISGETKKIKLYNYDQMLNYD